MMKFMLFIAVVSLAAAHSEIVEEIEELVVEKLIEYGAWTNPTHYGDPAGGCMADEIEGGIKGIKGKGCFPDCTDNPCPTDYPGGDTAPGECAVQGPNKKKYCILQCKGVATGKCPTGAKCVDVMTAGVCLYGAKEGFLGTEGEVELTVNFVPDYVRSAFEEFKIKYERTYVGEEHEDRLRVFHDNIKIIQDFYKEGPHTFELGIGPFADLTNAEFKAKYTGGIVVKKEQLNIVELDESNLGAGKDWRDAGAVTPVKNQAQCGSCWAFSAVAAMEGAYFQKNGQLKSFSEQQLVDCSKSYGNHGCQGGLMDFAFKYAETHMMDLESDYRYTAKNGQCHSADYTGVFETTSYSDVRSNSMSQLQAASDARVVSVAIEADKTVFQHYTGGVITSSACGTKLDHGVTVVGYTSDAWIVKNSWGPTWGEDGYVRIGKSNQNVCGILSQPSWPSV